MKRIFDLCKKFFVIFSGSVVAISFLWAIPEPPIAFPEPSNLGGTGDAPDDDPDGLPKAPESFLLTIHTLPNIDKDSDEYWQKRGLKWNSYPNAVNGYLIEGRVSSGPWEMVGRTSQLDTDFIVNIEGGIAGRRYHYRVVALGDYNVILDPEGGYSRIAAGVSNIVRYYPQSGGIFSRTRQRRILANKAGFSSVGGEPGSLESYKVWLDSEDEETSNSSSRGSGSERINSVDHHSLESSQSEYSKRETKSYSRIEKPHSSSSSGYYNYYEYDDNIQVVGRSSFRTRVRDSETSPLGRWSSTDVHSGSSQLEDISGSYFWRGTETFSFYSSSPEGSEFYSDIYEWNRRHFGFRPVYAQINYEVLVNEPDKFLSREYGSYAGSNYQESTDSYTSYKRFNEFTTEMLIEDVELLMKEDPNEFPDFAFSDWPTREEVIENSSNSLHVSGSKHLDSRELLFRLEETEYEFFTGRKLSPNTKHILAYSFTPEQWIDDYSRYDETTTSYKSTTFGDDNQGKLDYHNFYKGYGTYSVYPVALDLSVSDYRGTLDNFEEDVSYYIPNTLDEFDLDPSGATIYYNLEDAMAYVWASTSISGEDAKMVVSWGNSEVEVRGNHPDYDEYDPQPGTQNVKLSSPVRYKANKSQLINRRFTIGLKDGVEESGQVVFKMTIYDNNGTIVGSDSVTIHIAQYPVAPEDLGPDYYSIPLNDASGSRYRKVALNGRPISDEKPQATTEQDAAPEETYIDGFNLNLTHSVSDLYMPIPGSELALSIRRNYSPDIWNIISGLRPHERSDRMFGSGWSNGGIPYVHIIDPVGSNIDGFLEPPRAIVVDENGISHEFVQYRVSGQLAAWVPMPGGKHDGKSYLNSFDGTTFTRKHGTTINFESTTISKNISKSRVKGSSSYDNNTYLRAVKVTDRLGYSINYEYPVHALDASRKETLIPKRIYAKDSTDNEIPDQQIYIRQTDQQRITHAWDSKGNMVQYNYTPIVFDHPYFSNHIQRVHLLTSVQAPDSGLTEYTYNNGNQLYIESDPLEDQDLLNPGELPTVHYHIELSGIKDALGNAYSFGLKRDDTKETYVKRKGFTGYIRKSGLPRYVSSVDLPGIVDNATFRHLSGPVRVNYINGQEFLSSNTRRTSVTDTEGFTTTYDFSNIEMITLSSFKDFYADSPEELESLRFRNPRLIYYKNMSITHGDFGTETYTFNPEAGLALESATDLSGNTTTYQYSDVIPPGFWGTFTWPSGFSHFDDPTYESRPDGTEQSFTYGPYRIMESILDPRGNKTEYTLDAMGRRTDEKIFETATTLVQHTQWDYDYPEWNGFVSTEKKISLASDPGWATTLEMSFVPDDKGRIRTSTQKPGIDADGASIADLVTTYYYDLNNNKTCIVDPRLKETGFVYDERNRLIRTEFHDGTDVHTVYDLRGNRVGMINENEQSAVFKYDTLNRVTDHIQVMGSAAFDPSSPESFKAYAPSSDDLVTSTTYNDVNSILSVTKQNSSNTRITRMEYDGIQRLRFSKNLQAENAGLTKDIITEYIYNNNSGGSTFDTSNFQPEEITDPRGFTTTFTYDGYYRPLTVEVEYNAAGDTALTVNQYDALGNLELVTDPLLKQTETVFDALNRPTSITYAKGTTDEASSSIAYTSTGLQYQITDELSNTTTTEYDGAARPIKVIQPAVPVYGGGSETPITRTFYDAAGNVEFTENPLRKKWQTVYDDRNRPTDVIEPSVFDYDSQADSQPQTITTYDDLGNVLSVKDPRGFLTHTGYDRANRPIVTVSPAVGIAGETNDAYIATVMVYDRHSNVTETYTAKLAAVPALSTAAQSLSARDSIIANSNARRDALNTYDALGRLLTATDAENITVINEYDASSNRTAVIDGKTQRTEFEYDGLARNTITRHPDATFKTLVYNGVNQTQRIDELGRTTDYQYDHRHRLKDVLYTDASDENRAYSYDAVGNILTVIESGKAADTDVAYTYDALYRIETETSGGLTHRYAYDLAGNRSSTIYAEGTGNIRELVADYDALNRTKSITESGRVSTYTYDLSGNIREKGQANGDVIVKSYDALGRTESIRGPSGSDGQPLYLCTNAYDTFGNLAKLFETYPSGDAKLNDRTVTNTYDDANRLDTETIVTIEGLGQIVSIQTDYDYDDAHNRTSKTVTKQAQGGTLETLEDATYAYTNSLNQIDSYTDSISGKSISYDYDDNGNRTLKDDGTSTTNYSYDRENRLLTVDGDTLRKIDVTLGLEVGEPDLKADYIETGTTYTYAYDYRTRRVLRDESAAGGDSTQVVFSGGTSIQEYDNAATVPTVEYIRGSDYGGGIGGILYTLRSNAPFFKHYNGRGDVVAVTDGSGTLTYQAAYEAFGKHGDTASSAEWGSTEDRQQANTKDEDPTGLLNEGFRYRDLETGTFITRDPLGFVDGPNVYTYVVQNPWTYFDPYGLKVKKYEETEIPDDASDEERKKLEDKNKRIRKYNKRLDELKNSPGGSALYDYLDKHKMFFVFEFYKDNFGVSMFGKTSSGEVVKKSWKMSTFKGFEADRYQAHDPYFMSVAIDFYFNRSSYSGGGDNLPERMLDPNILKSMALTETGGTAINSRGQWWTNPLSSDNLGDEAGYKQYLSPGGDLAANIKRATEILTRKGYGTSGNPMRMRPSGTFDGWHVAVERYNGNYREKYRKADGRHHAEHYVEKVMKRVDNPGVYVPLQMR